MFYFIYFIKNIEGFTGCSSFLIISTTLLSNHISNFPFLLSSHRSPSPSLCSLLNFYFTHFSISIFVISQFLFYSFLKFYFRHFSIPILLISQFLFSFVLNFYYLFLISTVPLFSIYIFLYAQFFSPSLLNSFPLLFSTLSPLSLF